MIASRGHRRLSFYPAVLTFILIDYNVVVKAARWRNISTEQIGGGPAPFSSSVTSPVLLFLFWFLWRGLLLCLSFLSTPNPNLCFWPRRHSLVGDFAPMHVFLFWF